MNITFEQACDDYLNYQKLKGKPQSIRSIRSRLNNYVIPYFKNKYITTLTTKNYLDWQLQIESKKLSYKYKKALHYTVVALLNYCITFYELNIQNVASKVGNFKNTNCEKPKNDFWTYKEFLKFIKQVQDPIYNYLYKFIFFCGCRLGEALALKFSDVIGNYEYIKIERTISKEYINGKRAITTPKTKASIRNIRLTRLQIKIIKNLKKLYLKKYGYFDNEWFIFGGLKPLAPTTIERKKNIACKKANIKQIRMHDFRHSLATLLFSKGIPVTVISKMLGHADYITTLTVYIHAVPDDQKRIIHILNFLDLFKIIFKII